MADQLHLPHVEPLLLSPVSARAAFADAVPFDLAEAEYFAVQRWMKAAA